MSYAISFCGLPIQTARVSDKLIIGARQSLKGLAQLKREENVSTVIDLRNHFDFKQLKEILFCKLLGIKHINIPLEINNKNPLAEDLFNKAAVVTENNKSGNTFIHCNNGWHRTPMVAAWIQFKNGAMKTFNEFDEFLNKHNFYNLRKKVRYGFKFNLTSSEREMRTDNLNFQKQKLWEMITSAMKSK